MQSSFFRLSDDESQTSHRLRHTSVREDQRVASQNRTAAEAPSDHSLESESFRDNPLFQFMLLSVAAVGLYGVMLVLRRFAPSSIPHDSLIDVSAIALLIFSVFLVLVVRTLGRQIAKRKEAEHALRKTIAALDEAAEEARYLSGLLPICSACKCIRNASGSWEQIERYIEAHSEASFTHGICPDCSHELYPGLDLNGDRKQTSAGGL